MYVNKCQRILINTNHIVKRIKQTLKIFNEICTSRHLQLCFTL